MTAPVPEEVAARYIVLQQALAFSGAIAADHPLEPTKMTTPPFYSSGTTTAAEQRMDLTIRVADWLLGERD